MRIYYGICGEGLGHSGRSLALIERLTALGHVVNVFTFADAYRLLASSGLNPHRIQGLQWKETACGGVSTVGTLCNLRCFLRNRCESIDYIRQQALVERPDLFITDFEPLTALAATSLKIPCVSIDNQHRFCQKLGDCFPWRLKAYGRLAGEFVRRWISGPRECIVSVFHDCPPSSTFRRVDPMFRERIAGLQATQGDHVLIYGRSAVGRRIAEIAAKVPARFIGYGFEGPAAPHIEYRRASYDQFAADLASSRAVIAMAGHQLISEARYFGKPLLVVPMPNQHEQAINAYYARLERFGEFVAIEKLTPEHIRHVLNRPAAPARRSNGVDQVIDLLGIGYG